MVSWCVMSFHTFSSISFSSLDLNMTFCKMAIYVAVRSSYRFGWNFACDRQLPHAAGRTSGILTNKCIQWIPEEPIRPTKNIHNLINRREICRPRVRGFGMLVTREVCFILFLRLELNAQITATRPGHSGSHSRNVFRWSFHLLRPAHAKAFQLYKIPDFINFICWFSSFDNLLTSYRAATYWWLRIPEDVHTAMHRPSPAKMAPGTRLCLSVNLYL